MHIDEVHRPDTPITGGGFADVYKEKLNNGQFVALKVPRNFGSIDQMRKVNAVSQSSLVKSLFL